jgi:hypothetical protein
MVATLFYKSPNHFPHPNKFGRTRLACTYFQRSQNFHQQNIDLLSTLLGKDTEIKQTMTYNTKIGKIIPAVISKIVIKLFLLIK